MHTLKTFLSARMGKDPAAWISTPTLDRDGDVIEPRGMRAENYRKNPVVLFGHDHMSIPVGRTVALDVTDAGVQARWKWLEGDPDAERVRHAWEQGVLSATSIGFLPLAAEPLPNGGRRFKQWELLEFSIVSVPSNPEALALAKSLGLGRPPEAGENLCPCCCDQERTLRDLRAEVRRMLGHDRHPLAREIAAAIRAELSRSRAEAGHAHAPGRPPYPGSWPWAREDAARARRMAEPPAPDPPRNYWPWNVE